MHCCPHCRRNYQRKLYYDRHVGLCEFLCKSKQQRKLDIEEQTDTPTVRELYMVVMELVRKNKQLEDKLNEMSKSVHIKSQKLNIIEWLNATYKESVIDYPTWLKQIQIKREHLHFLLESDYATGIVNILKQQLPLENERRPLRAFNSKDNTFYLYNHADHTWSMMDNETYLKMMYALDKQMTVEFGNWQRENKDKLYSDEYSLKYNTFMKKMMATREPMYSRIKRELYQHLRTAMPQMIEYAIA